MMLRLLISFQYNNEWFLIAAGENGVFVTTKELGTGRRQWVKVLSMFKVYDLLVVKNLLLVVSKNKLYSFDIDDVMALYNSPMSYIKEIRGFSMVEDKYIGVIRFKNNSLFVTTLAATASQRETILALEPNYDLNENITSFRKKYEFPAHFNIFNLQIFEKTMVTVSSTGFFVSRIGRAQDPLPTLNEGLGFNSFPTHNETTSVKVASFGTPVEFLKIDSLDLCLLCYANLVLVSNLKGDVFEELGWRTGFRMTQARFNRLVSEPSDLDSTLFSMSAITERKSSREKPRSESPLSEIHTVASTIDSCQPQMVVQF
ncbi:unnamed protein product [Ambrosiozyma monospora]|uniref:Unnamed protein product n=1 Tax=Ambrosiozyma monospora TaxID=43982 RepID=A0ACB5TTS0_AMBMO|nr:unnamed protein product [Ambrosiozyma monospora]